MPDCRAKTVTKKAWRVPAWVSIWSCRISPTARCRIFCCQNSRQWFWLPFIVKAVDRIGNGHFAAFRKSIDEQIIIATRHFRCWLKPLFWMNRFFDKRETDQRPCRGCPSTRMKSIEWRWLPFQTGRMNLIILVAVDKANTRYRMVLISKWCGHLPDPFIRCRTAICIRHQNPITFAALMPNECANFFRLRVRVSLATFTILKFDAFWFPPEAFTVCAIVVMVVHLELNLDGFD